MEVKNGIIIDGVLHEALNNCENYIDCDSCSLSELCDRISIETCLCYYFSSKNGFINRGEVTNIEIEEETK